MDDLSKKARLLGDQLEPKWTDHHVNASLVRLHASVRSRARRRRLAWTAGGVLGVAAAGVFFFGAARRPDLRVVSVPATERFLIPARVETERTLATNASLGLVDGSRITALEDNTRVVTTQLSPRRVHVRLRSGSARFEVVRNAQRTFYVDASNVHIEVIGTVFSVARNQAGVHVHVIRGKVRVRSTQGERMLLAGETSVFRESETATEQVPREEPKLKDESLAEALKLSRPHPSQTKTLEYMLAKADVARLSDRPEEAVELLRRALALGLPSSREAIAVFTMARVLLDDLGRASEAAEAFARARRVFPQGPLAEDALAREVESWAKAGAHDLARRRAHEYVDAYPNGRRTRLVKKFGGTD